VPQDTAELMKAFVSRRHRAVTIAQRMVIGTLVVDARIIDATPEAAAWYGVAEPQHLIHRWISLVHHPDDAKLGRTLALARHLGIVVPTRYVSRIAQLQTPGTFRAVLKDTTQLTVGNETYWITVLLEPTEPPLALQSSWHAHWPVPPSEEVTRFCGHLSVADMEALLYDQRMDTPRLSQITTADASQKSSDALASLLGPTTPTAGNVLRPGQTYRMPTGRYLHWCAVCGNVWRSGVAYPVQCGYRLCHSPAWRLGKAGPLDPATTR
jgi:hypothetical protein